MSILLPKYFKKKYNILILLITVSCAETNIKDFKTINIERFERIFYNSDSVSLENVIDKYPYFFPKKYTNEVWINRLNDPIQKEIFSEIDKEFNNLVLLEDQISSFFEKNKYFFPKQNHPKIITINTDINYFNKIILTDSILLIGLDNYLGSDHRFYENIPEYIREDLNKNKIISDIAEEYALKLIPKTNFYTFLDKIIFYGKILYYKDVTIENYSDRLKIGYSDKKMKWALKNEYNTWVYFIENEILYDPDNKLNSRFSDDAPFSRFYLDFDNESSEMIGKFIGWRIIKSYMKYNKSSLQEMLETNPVDIINKSKYKPKKL